MLGGTLPTTAEMRRLENHHADLVLQTGNFRELLLTLWQIIDRMISVPHSWARRVQKEKGSYIKTPSQVQGRWHRLRTHTYFV